MIAIGVSSLASILSYDSWWNCTYHLFINKTFKIRNIHDIYTPFKFQIKLFYLLNCKFVDLESLKWCKSIFFYSHVNKIQKSITLVLQIWIFVYTENSLFEILDSNKTRSGHDIAVCLWSDVSKTGENKFIGISRCEN